MDYKPRNESERRILEYFNANASDDLKARVEASKKTPAGAVKFMESEVRKRFSGASGMVTITDEEGFGIAMHYFEDGNADEFEPGRKSAKTPAPDGEQKTPPTARKAKKAKTTTPEVAAEKKEPEATKPDKPKMSTSEERDRAAGQTFLF